jgi:glucose/arabinose dehydrogenase
MVVLVGGVLGWGCAAPEEVPEEEPENPGELSVTLVPVLSGLQAPLLVTAPPSDARLFVVEQPGRIRVVRGGALLSTPFLNISDSVAYGGERGLLGLAFDPQFQTNGRFFVNYTSKSGDGDTRVESYRASSGSDVADRASRRRWLDVDQPYANHNGGDVKFGPDGMLYVALGDGGSGGDPHGHGQDLGTLLGSLLRLDVSSAEPPYRVPADNPFVGRPGARAEIWHYGLRNPWRFSFDRVGGMLWIADVGQNAWEEVNAVAVTAKGLNFGWAIREGLVCYGSQSCTNAGLTPPVAVYSHGEGCSVTGGHVYRGQAIPALRGAYVYGDLCRGWIRALRPGPGSTFESSDLGLARPGTITSFGEDSAGELYVVTQEGNVFRFAEGG